MMMRRILTVVFALSMIGTGVPAHAQTWPVGEDQRPEGAHGVAEKNVKETGRFDPIPDVPLNTRNSQLPAGTHPAPLDAQASAVQNIELLIDRDGVPADGQSVVKLTIRLLDKDNRKLGGVINVTVETSRGRLQGSDRLDAVDRDLIAPGRQVRIENGEGHVYLVAPDESGDANIRITAGAKAVRGRMSFVPALRDMLAVGLIEGVIHVRNLRAGSLVAARPSDGFEQEIRHFQREFGGDNSSLGLRTAFFLKGKILGEYLLTAAYDSDKDVKSRLFRDIKPNEFYPIYGDSSLRGYDARSTGRLYVRVDKDRSYLLYGDFTTASTVPGLQLGNYSRTSTGLKYHYEQRNVMVDAFVTRDSLKRVVDEIPGRGISGPYFLTRGDGLINSETVEIITRDRNQPAVILKRVLQARLVDYDFEPLSGRLLFKGPIPTLDENFNPVFIRVQYEVDQGGDKFWVGGVSAQARFTNWLEVGGSYAEDQNPLARYKLYSANTTFKLGERTVVTAEFARSDSAEQITLGTLGLPNNVAAPVGRGDARRIELRHTGEQLDARLFHGRADANFNNPTSPISAGRSENSAKLTFKVTPSTRLIAEALQSEDTITGGRRRGGYLGVETDLTPSFKLEAGVRAVRETVTPAQAASVGLQPFSPTTQFFNSTGGASIATSAPPGTINPGDIDQLSARLRLTWSATDRIRLFGEYEQELRDGNRHAAGVGGDYRFAERGRIYARHEFSNSLSGIYGLNTGNSTHGTVVGIDTEYVKDAQMFSEYRIRDAGAGRDVQAAVGLRNLWTVAEGLRLSTTFENVHILSGKGGDATAITLGAEYTASPLWKGSARLEWREAPTATTWLSTLALARKLDRDWTMLARNVYSLTLNDTGGDQTLNRFQAGVAYRDTDTNRVNALARYELKFENDTNSIDPVRRLAHIVSTHADYHPTRTFTLLGQYATKWLCENFGGVRSDFNAHLFATRIIYDVTDRWDVGLNLSILTDRSFRSRQYGIGPEVGYLVMDNLWASVGYNFQGFRDKDLVESDYTARGVYFRLRFKFDHRLFRSKDPDINRTLSRGG